MVGIPMFISQDMIDFIHFLKRNKVKYVLVGGFAVIYYGYVRMTQDMDVLIEPSRENANKMMKVLQEFGFGDIGFSQSLLEKEGTAIHLGAEPNRIDILTSLKGVSNSSIFSNLKRIRYKGLLLNVISLKDLLECKKHSNRTKDLADVEVLEKTVGKKALGRGNRKKKSGR
jgi:predicted nucleotidyltransferase